MARLAALLHLLTPSALSTSPLTPVLTFRTHGSAGCATSPLDASSLLLACANFWDGAAPDMVANSTLYRVSLNPSSPSKPLALAPLQHFQTKGAHGADMFTVDSRTFLLLPSYYGCGTARGPAPQSGCSSTAVLRREGGAAFVPHQALFTSGPAQTAHTLLPSGAALVAVGENFADAVCLYTLRPHAPLFERLGAACLPVPGAGAVAFAPATPANPLLLVAASYHDGGWATRSAVFASADGTGGDLRELQRVPTQGAHGVALRRFAHGLYLFFAEDRGEAGPKVGSSLLLWGEGAQRFEPLQALPTDGAHGARFFGTPDGECWLFVANFGDRLGGRYASRSALWRRGGGGGGSVWEMAAEVPSQGATDVAPFELGGRTFLALSNEGDLGRRAHQLSAIYEVRAAGGGGGGGSEL